jgi:hypothetical protein
MQTSELHHVFAQALPDPSDPHNAVAAVRAAYLTATGRGEEAAAAAAEPAPADKRKPKEAAVGEDCPMWVSRLQLSRAEADSHSCYEEMTQVDLDASRLVFDESSTGCGNGLHRECFQMWAGTAVCHSVIYSTGP